MLNDSSASSSGLSSDVIRKIRAVFSRCPALEQAILYGSRAKGGFRRGSDIDLTLVGSALEYSDLVDLERELDEVMLPYKFDLSLLSQIENPSLIDHIKRVGVTFYEKGV